VSVENGLDARLSENRGRCDAEKKREPGNSDDHRNSYRNNKGRFHLLTPMAGNYTAGNDDGCIAQMQA
jgi:hypothetical protein